LIPHSLVSLEPTHAPFRSAKLLRTVCNTFLQNIEQDELLFYPHPDVLYDFITSIEARFINIELGLDAEYPSYDKNFVHAEAYMPHKYLLLSRIDKRHLLDEIDRHNGVDLFLNPIHAIFANDIKISLMIAPWEQEMHDPQNAMARRHKLAARVSVLNDLASVPWADQQNLDGHAGNCSNDVP
jgi:hypothetical protein